MNLICYLSNGYPSIEKSVEMADMYLENGCDIIEIDFPSRNPYLDSPFIQDRMKKALEVCSDYNQYMLGMAEIRKRHPDNPFIILIYEETLEEIGAEKFISFCLEHSFTDVIYIGSNNMKLHAKCIESGLRISTYIQFHLPEDDVEIAKKANGFIYLQSKPAEKLHPLYGTLEQCINYLRQEVKIATTRPIYCGVGVSTPGDIALVKSCGGDGVFVGSAILKLHDDPRALQQRIQEMKKATL